MLPYRHVGRSAPLLLVLALGAGFTACDSGPKPGEEGVYWGKKALEGDLKSRETAMTHLVQLKDPKSLPALQGVMKSDAVDLKPQAAQLIGEIGDAQSVDALVEGVDWNAGAGSDRKSRKAATANERIAQALPRVAKPGDEKAIEALKRLSGSNHLNTQLAAVIGLGELDAKSAVQDLIDIADGHPNNFMVKNAIMSLGKIGDEKAIPILVKMLFFERGVSFYREASYALFELGKPSVSPLIQVYQGKYEPISELHVEAGIMKAKALEVLTDIGDERVIPFALETGSVVASDTGGVLARAKAHIALGRLGVEKAAPILMKHWDDVDVSKSEFAVQAIAQIGARQAARPLLAMSTHAGFIDQCVKKQQNAEGACRFSEAQVRKIRLEALSRLAGGELLADWDAMIAESDKAAAEEAEKAKTREGAEKQVAEQAAKGHAKTKELLIERKPMLEAAKECAVDSACWAGKLKSDNPRVREKAGYELLFKSDPASMPALMQSLGDQDNEARYAAILAVWRRLPEQGGVARIDEILKAEKGKTQFVRINEDLKRLRVKVARGY
jgi:HEAT repeat protein